MLIKRRGNINLEVWSEDSYNLAFENLCEAHQNFTILKSPSSCELVVKKEQKGICYLEQSLIDIMKSREQPDLIINNKLFGECISEITKDLYKNITNILRQSEIKEIKRNELYPEKKFNREIWNKLPVKGRFYMLDVDRFYWCTAFLLGYISESVFKYYFYDEDYKDVTLLSIGRLGSGKSINYYINGKLFEITKNDKKIPYIISCNTWVEGEDENNENLLFHRIYNNVINESKNVIAEIAYKYRYSIYGTGIDNIFFPDDKQMLTQLNNDLMSKGYDCKYEYCYKITSDSYAFLDDIDIWSTPRKISFF